jgi:hypothetical protein
MPVLVTRGETALGRHVVDALLADGAPEVRATVPSRSAQRGLVLLGVRTAVLEWETAGPERAAHVLAGVHTVVVVDEGDLPGVARAAPDAGVRRVLVLNGEVGGVVDGLFELIEGGPDAQVVAAVLAADRRD